VRRPRLFVLQAAQIIDPDIQSHTISTRLENYISRRNKADTQNA